MTSNKNSVSTPDNTPDPTVGKTDQNNFTLSSFLDIRSTYLDQTGTDPTAPTNLTSDVPSKTPTPVDNNTESTPLDSMEEFKTDINEIIETVYFLTATISYENKTVLLQLDELGKDIKDAASKYQYIIAQT